MIEIDIGLLGSDLRVTVPAEQDSLPLVRQALRSVGEIAAAEPELLEDAELALTEALANAVEHAYGDAEGEVRVTVDPREHELLVTVSDDGAGMPPAVRRHSEGRGYGLSMIEGVTDKLIFAGGSGTELRMVFRLGEPSPETVDGGAPGIAPTEQLVRRLVAVVAAQRDMPSDRVVEALLVAEMVARNALRYLTGERARIAIHPAGEGFELRVGPLELGGGDAAVADSEVPVVGRVIERLSQSVSVETAGSEEQLVVRLS